MSKVTIKCAYCGKKFQRERGRYNEAIKERWNQYCSKECQNKSQFRRVEKICANPNCNKIVSRPLKEFKKSKSGRIFCSSSCAAIFNNSRRRKTKKCLTCDKEFFGNQKYCSTACRPKPHGMPVGYIVVSKDQVIREIRKFYKNKKRIPLKREFVHYHAAQRRFGTWNKAISAAGFDPNPVKFAKKYIANDGHRCDSLSEKIIDDWLYARRIPHNINVPYGKNRMTADFRVDDVLIEFFGLQGELEDYDNRLSEKKKLWEQKKMKIIEIYPKDLFPESKLDVLLSCLL